MKIIISYLVLAALMAAAIGVVLLVKGDVLGLILLIMGLAVGMIILYRATYKYFS